MQTKLGSFWRILKETIGEWVDDNAMMLAAAVAYSAIFSIAPLLVIAIAVAGLFYNQEMASGALSRQLQTIVGTSGAEAIEEMVISAGQRESGIWPTVLSIITLLLGATGVVVTLKNSLNQIWGVVANPDRGWLGLIIDRVLSLAIVLTVGFLLLVSLMLTTVLSAIGEWALTGLGIPLPAAFAINFAVSFLVIILLFATLFKFLPDVDIRWSDVWIGAGITTVLFLIGKVLIGLYLVNAGVQSSYGGAGSFAVLLIWTYYSCLILFLGAEFTQVYARTKGSELTPARGAIPIAEWFARQSAVSRKLPASKKATSDASASADAAPQHRSG